MRKLQFLIILALLFLSSRLFPAIIHGFVRDKHGKEPLVMVNVWVTGLSIGTITNMKGYFVLPALPPGEYQLNFRLLGYKLLTLEQKIEKDDAIDLEVFLEEEVINISEVVVSAEREQQLLDVKTGHIAISASQLRVIPQVAEPDLFRALQLLPGVATLSDFSAGLYIRGGSPDQNLILLDQIDVYNPNHLFGFFSAFNIDAIKSAELLKGGFPAIYGGRLSSVLNVINKDGNREKVHGVARMSMLSSSATVEGPWRKGSWMISGRRTYLDLAAKISDFYLPYYFYDAHMKVNLDLDKNNLCSLSLYGGNDLLDYDQQGSDINLNWGNRTFSAQWTHLFAGDLFSHFVFAGSRFHSKTSVQYEEVSFGIQNEIVDWSLKGMLTYSPVAHHSFDFGFELKDLNFGLKYKIVDTNFNNQFSGKYVSSYVQDSFHIHELSLLQAGVRYEYYTDGSYSRIAPRILYKRILSDKISLNASYGLYYQFLNQVQQEGFNFADMWLPVDKTFKPGEAAHYGLGLAFDNRKTVSISVEGYYKKYRNIAEYRTFRFDNEELYDQTAGQNFYSGRAVSYGVDLYVRNHWHGIKGWIGYSFSWSQKQVNGYNFNRAYYPTYDRRHTVVLIEDFKLNRTWRLNFAFKFGSGQPFTQATARYMVMDPAGRTHFEVLEGDKNSYRLPAYHRLDVGLFHDIFIFSWHAEIFIQAVNLYNHKNVWYRRYAVFENPATVKDYAQLPFVPSAGISIMF